jgi:hypothetical protein
VVLPSRMLARAPRSHHFVVAAVRAAGVEVIGA